MRDCLADAWSAKTKMKITGRNENRLITTRSIGSRKSGKASNNPMYIASRILDFNRSPHDFDERILEARRFERHLALLPQAPLDDGQDLLGRLGLEDLGGGRPIPRGRLHDHPHPHAGISLRLVDGPEEDRPSLVHDEQMVREIGRASCRERVWSEMVAEWRDCNRHDDGYGASGTERR